MPFSSQNPEDRIATAISTYCERDNPKMSNWAPEFDVPYNDLDLKPATLALTKL